MHLRIGDNEVPVEIEGEQQFESRHTGAALRKRSVNFSLPTDQALDAVQRVFGKAMDLSLAETDGAGREVAQWRVAQSSYMYSDGPPYVYSLELEEAKELHVDGLVLDGIEFHPYEYRKEFDGDALVIEARVLLTEGEYERLAAFVKDHERSYFTVRRIGISDQALEMRFGQTLWSSHEQGIKHDLRLVEKKLDEAGDHPFHGFNEPEFSNLARVALTRAARLDALLDKLKEKGVLSDDEIQALTSGTDRASWESLHDLRRVDDLDEW